LITKVTMQSFIHTLLSVMIEKNYLKSANN